MITTNSIVWILFLAIYGVDTVCTIIHRLYLKQNIFEAHRLHLYQILSNEKKVDHRIVAFIYGLVQAVLSFIIVILYMKNYNQLYIVIGIILPLLIVYSFKFKLLKK